MKKKKKKKKLNKENKQLQYKGDYARHNVSWGERVDKITKDGFPQGIYLI